MREADISEGEAKMEAARIVIEMPSLTIHKGEDGYQCKRKQDPTFRHLPDCVDLWDAIDAIRHHVCLTPSMLMELYSLEQKCAELRWDERSVAGYYEELASARAKASAAKAERKPSTMEK